MDDSDITLERLQRAFDKLPRRHQQVFSMHRHDALTYHQIAEQLGLSAKLVEWTMAETMFLLMQSVDDQARDYRPNLIARIERALFFQCWRLRRRFERRP